MTITISPVTEALLKEHAERLGESTQALADALLQDALSQSAADFEETCQAIREGLADMEAGRTVTFDEVHAQWEAQKASRERNAPSRT